MRSRVRPARRRAPRGPRRRARRRSTSASRQSDHFEFYWFPHTDRAMTKTNTRLPESAPRHPLPPVGKWIDDIARRQRPAPGRVQRRARRARDGARRSTARRSRMWGDREFTDASTRVFATQRSVRFREMEYALPAENVRPAFEALRALDRRARLAHRVPRRGALRRGGRPVAVDRARPRLGLHRRPPLLARGPHRVLRGRRADHARRTADVRTGARCTRWMPRSSASATPGSTTSSPCAIGSTPIGCSRTAYLERVLGE